MISDGPPPEPKVTEVTESYNNCHQNCYLKLCRSIANRQNENLSVTYRGLFFISKFGKYLLLCYLSLHELGLYITKLGNRYGNSSCIFCYLPLKKPPYMGIKSGNRNINFWRYI